MVDYTLTAGFDFISQGVASTDKHFVYFFRRSELGIPNFDSIETANIEMPLYIMMGVATGNFIHNVSFLTKQVILYTHVKNYGFCNNFPFFQLFVPLFKTAFTQSNEQKSKSTKSTISEVQSKEDSQKNPLKLVKDAKRVSSGPSPVASGGRVAVEDRPHTSTPLKDQLLSEIATFENMLEW